MTVQNLLPRNFSPMALRIETMSTVQALKEQLCEKISQGDLKPDLILIQMLTGGAHLNDAMTLAHYNLDD